MMENLLAIIAVLIFIFAVFILNRREANPYTEEIIEIINIIDHAGDAVGAKYIMQRTYKNGKVKIVKRRL